MTERDELGSPLRRHYPGQLGGDERVPLGERAERLGSRVRHTNLCPCDRAAAGKRLRAHVDHVHIAAFPDVAQPFRALAHVGMVVPRWPAVA